MRSSRSSRGPEQVSKPAINAELKVLRAQGNRLRMDGDLTGIPVSNTSQTYPNAAFGHMDDEIRLGYQAGVVSLESPTYGRLWLSVTHHPGDTVSCTQAEALVLAAEARTRLRPRRPDSVAPPALSRGRAAGSPNRRAAGNAEASREAGQAAAGRSRATDAGAEASGG